MGKGAPDEAIELDQLISGDQTVLDFLLFIYPYCYQRIIYIRQSYCYITLNDILYTLCGPEGITIQGR